MLLDFHSHILPGIDDGSRSVDESASLLKMLAEQGAEIVVATPHYDANRSSVERFLIKRSAAYESLRDVITEDMPAVRLGAEVMYYPGISRMDGLDKLCIEGSRLLLLEMPMSKWSKYTADELRNMSATRGVTVVIAHVERCIGYQDKDMLESLINNDVLCQINATFLLNLATRRKALGLLKNGLVQLVGTDCHNIKTRPPRLSEAYDVISRKLGEHFTSELLQYGRSLIIKR